MLRIKLKLLDYFALRPARSSLLKDVRFSSRKKIGKRLVFPKTFTRLWNILAPRRLGFKPFDYYSNFLKLPPYPFPTHNTYFRQQSRTFVFWYEFAARKYNITLDFGLKQKKTISEKVVWNRRTLRDGRPQTPWWTYLRRNSSYRRVPYFFFKVNDNRTHPLFPISKSTGHFWFEETLPLFRRYAHNFYSRITSARSNTVFLSQSIFDGRTLFRKSPLDATTLWLSSPIHDYSVFLKGYHSNRTMLMPERFFQFRQRQRHHRYYWTQLLFRFWPTFKSTSSILVPAFTVPSLDFYQRARLWQLGFASFSSILSIVGSVFFALDNRRQLASASKRFPWVDVWYSQRVPAASRRRRSPYLYRRIRFFVKRHFFLRHLSNRMNRWQGKVALHIRLQNPPLKLLLARLFQLYAFTGPLPLVQLLSLWKELARRNFIKPFSVVRFALKRPRRWPRHARRRFSKKRY